LLFPALALYDPAVKWIDAHPGLAFLLGALLVLVWLGWFGREFARNLDYFFRTCDFLVNRTYGPRVQDRTLPDAARLLLERGGLLKGYSPPIVVWTLAALTVLIFGPARSVWSDPAGLLDLVQHPLVTAVLFVLLVALTLSGCFYFSWCKARLHGFTTLLILALAAGIGCWLWLNEPGPEGPPVAEADALLYPHVFLLFVAFAAGLGYVARLLACKIVAGFNASHGAEWKKPDVLRRVELFLSPHPPELTIRHVLRSAFDTPLRQPHLLVFPVAAVVLVVPYAYMTFSAVITALVTWTVLAVAGVHERLNTVLDCLRRNFFHGVLWGASALVIVLAACRFFDVSYVATIANSASNASLVSFLAATYLTLWYFKYWTGYVLCERLLTILRDQPDPEEQGPGQLRYAIDSRYIGTSVRPADRYVQVHGTRFAAVGTYRRRDQTGVAWEYYDPLGLFESILAKRPQAPRKRRARSAGAQAAAPEPVCRAADPQKLEELFALSDLRQRVHVYYAVLDGLLLLALAVFLWGLEPPAKAELQADQQAQGVVHVQQRLFEPTDLPGNAAGKRRAAILFAASGGGTRAALYGAAVLRGLQELGALEDVEVCSGVSGGSAAIAHFAIHRAELADPAEQDQAWSGYADAMSAPFIDEVLCGTLEWRVARGTRMGTLLDESLQRHLQRHVPLQQGMKLADAPVGVLFNTTLAGTEPTQGVADPTNAGSRLVVTNLQIDADTFPTKGYEGVDTEFLPFIVVQDPTVRLATGAALSANFPPVFPNAAVDLKKDGSVVERHWITDGGAAENRGDITLLYVLLHALEREAAGRRRTPPAIRIVIAEASGVSLDFSQDRGLGSILSASGKFSNQLMVELLGRVAKAYAALGGPDLETHFVPMPLALRSRGGVGTHWKMPAFVTLANPQNKEQTLNIRGTLARQMIMDLFVAGRKVYAESEDPQIRKAWAWAEGTDAEKRFAQHRPAWERLTKSFQKLGYGPKPP
jgi:hypothetical protein